MDIEKAKKIFYAALNAVDPFNAVMNSVKVKGPYLQIGDEKSFSASYDLDRYKNIKVVGCGKAVWPMCMAMEKIAGEKISGGLAVTKYGHVSAPYPLIIEIREASHPFPDLSGCNATVQTVKLLESAGEDDLIIALVSGGASSLWAMPVLSVTLEELRETTRKLIGCGATIREINTVRKHLSCIAGGFGALKAFPATVIVLVISDVIGDHLDTIGSGPFFPDNTTFKDAVDVLKNYDLFQNIPLSAKSYLEQGCQKLQPETPENDSIYFKNVFHQIISSNKSALDAAKYCAESLGFKAFTIEEPTVGEAQQAAQLFCKKVNEISNNTTSDKLCIIAGGETTVNLGNACGIGGRNQEFALAAALEIQGMDGVTVLSCGTDGTDGPTDANGAIVDGNTISFCKNSGLDPSEALKTHDSYTLLSKSGNLIKTGPTYTNVMDLQIAIIRKTGCL